MSATPLTADQDRGSRILSATRVTRESLPRLETYSALVLTLAGIYVRALQAINAGGLWRDEAVSVQVASLPTLRQLWSYLEFDSYPPLFHFLLRGWITFVGPDDESLRFLGALIGLVVLAAFWVAARTLGVRVPLLALTLLGLNPVLVRWGDSMRAYGLGCALAVLALAAIWKIADPDRLNWRRWLLAAGVGVLSVQCLYHNAVLLLAGCLAGAVVAMLGHRWKVAASVVAAGLPAALSLLPYLPIIRRTREWSVLIKFPVTPGWLWQCLTEATGVPIASGVWIWAMLVLAGIGVTGWRIMALRKHANVLDSAARRQVFAAVALVSAVAMYAAFLVTVGYTTQAWYYLPLLSFVAVCLDTLFGQKIPCFGYAGWRLGICAGWSILLLWHAPEWPSPRSTNLDLVARELNRDVKRGDLVLVNRWECAITLARYYHGPAVLKGIPDLPDHTAHRYDLFKKDMMAADPLRPLLNTVADTLKSGGRIWLVGRPYRPEDGRPARPLPAYTSNDPTATWPMVEYTTNWVLQVDDMLFRHTTGGTVIAVQPNVPVSEFEDLPLGYLQGWQDSPTADTAIVTPDAP